MVLNGFDKLRMKCVERRRARKRRFGEGNTVGRRDGKAEVVFPP